MKIALSFLIIIFVSCKEKKTNTPEVYAQEYCNCLVKNRVNDNLELAHSICDTLLEQNINFKVYITKDKRRYSKDIIDSSENFMEKFSLELDKKCSSLWPKNIPNQMLIPFE